MATCDLCGTVSDEREPPLAWSLTLEGGRARRYCEPCTREHLRTLEGKLDPHDW